MCVTLLLRKVLLPSKSRQKELDLRALLGINNAVLDGVSVSLGFTELDPSVVTSKVMITRGLWSTNIKKNVYYNYNLIEYGIP